MTVRLRNVSPLGDLDVPALGRVVKFGEEFDCPEAVAGREPSDDDPGLGLLAGYFKRVTPQKSAAKPSAPAPSPTED